MSSPESLPPLRSRQDRSESVAKICFVSVSALGLRTFLLPHIAEAARSYSVTVAADIAVLPEDLQGLANVKLRRVRFVRHFSIKRDFEAFVELVRVFFSEKPKAVVTLHPKAGFMGGVAAWLARVPVRIHWFTGQVWVTESGLYRGALFFLDFIVARLSTHNLVDSHSQRAFLVEKGILSASKTQVFGNGSISGIDFEKFHPDRAARRRARKTLGISPSVFVFVFVGRLTRDKGVLDLVEAAEGIHKSVREVHLLWVGPDEDGFRAGFERRLEEAGVGCTFVGEVPNPEGYVQIADALILPSYREGFGMAVIEAGATGVPSIVSDIYGLADSVWPFQTGLVHRVGNVGDLRVAMELIVLGKALRRRLAENSIERSNSLFSRSDIVKSFQVFLRESVG